ncbi:MAG TPA: methylmalonyl Co-A mutase-associated GTPase MeaB [Acidimicrobiales bacterium]|nr:methylmalonyl Co-A mutase-associated GTPase MeaB [Acidimicrobiales bacterium]
MAHRLAGSNPHELLAAARAGDRRALARLLTLVERAGDDGRDVAAAVFPPPGQAWVVGLTGPPGAGKSTLVDRVVRLLRDGSEPVAVVAVDPSSPASGGAVLGDRVRLQAHADDPGVFVRSVASRGVLGGLAAGVPDMVRVLDAVGWWPWVLVETVGVGQGEVDATVVADTTVVVLAPGWGDAVQADKAGLLEVADVFVVNKCDRPGADEARSQLERMLDLGPAGGRPGGGWRPPVVGTAASTGDGVAELWEAVGRHRAWLAEGGRLQARRAARLAAELRRAVERQAGENGLRRCDSPDFEELANEVTAGRLAPHEAVERLLA